MKTIVETACVSKYLGVNIPTMISLKGQHTGVNIPHRGYFHQVITA